jgi:hypothetical protein
MFLQEITGLYALCASIVLSFTPFANDASSSFQAAAKFGTAAQFISPPRYVLRQKSFSPVRWLLLSHFMALPHWR